MKSLLLYSFLLLFSISTWGQKNEDSPEKTDCVQNLEQLKLDYEAKSTNLFAYSKYLRCLFLTGEKKDARKLIDAFSKKSNSTLVEWDKQAYIIVFENDYSLVEDPQFIYNNLAVSAASKRWQYLGLGDLSKLVLESSSAALNSPNLYESQLKEIYEEEEDIEKLLPIYISQIQSNIEEDDKKDLENKILNLMDDEENLQRANNFLSREIQANPQVSAISKMLFWILEKKDNWSAALQFIEEIEENQSLQYRLYQDFISDAIAADQANWADQAYGKMEENIQDDHLSERIFLDRMHFFLSQQPEKLDLNKVDTSRYAELVLSDRFLNSDYLLDYTDFIYHHLDQPYLAIDILEDLIERQKFTRVFKSRVELKLGDYFAQDGDRWDAVLYYSRVEKSNKDNPLGEDARFKNAKLSYYFGDFDWAKDQLEILKTATQEPIANDALELWLRIIENTPSDSDFTAMQKLAKAEWYLWQDQYDSARIEINTISMLVDKDNPVMDDVYLLTAEINHEMGDYASERKNLQKIITDYKDNVIADDAYYRLALLDIQEGKPEDARLLLQQFLLNFDNSPLLIEVKKLLEETETGEPTP